MKVMGFSFNKISVERFSDKLGKVKINTNIDISEVKKVDSSIFQGKDDVLEVKFNYSIDYEPKAAKISFSGKTLILADQKTSKEFLEMWKKKRLPDQYRVLLFNVILKKANLRALQLEDELNLPPHIPLPTVKSSNKK